MSFGTVFKTDDDIIELLRSAYDAFTDVLNKMQDKFEFGLEGALGSRSDHPRDRGGGRGHPPAEGEISSQKGSTYFARMQYGRLIDAALQARSERYVAEIFQALRDVSVASRSNKPIGDRMIMNAAFLVGRETEQAFDARVKDIGQRYDKLTFKYTGPWPPYNFVNIRLKLERAHSVNRSPGVHPRFDAHRRPALRARQDRRGRRHRAQRRHGTPRTAAGRADARRARRDEPGRVRQPRGGHARAAARDPRARAGRGPAALSPSDYKITGIDATFEGDEHS